MSESASRGGPAPRLAIFARAPVRGQVKTRLARDVGEDVALAAYQELVERTLDRLGPGEGDFAPEIWIAGDAPVVGEWRGRFPVFRQPAGDLGERMAAAFRDGVRALVGCDIPALGAAHVETALALLEEADLTLGPTEDGGYCLIAMNEPRERLFVDIPWGTPDVLVKTLAAAGGLRVRLLAPLWDVDDGADLARWRNNDVRVACGGSNSRRPNRGILAGS